MRTDANCFDGERGFDLIGVLGRLVTVQLHCLKPKVEHGSFHKIEILIQKHAYEFAVGELPAHPVEDFDGSAPRDAAWAARRKIQSEQIDSQLCATDGVREAGHAAYFYTHAILKIDHVEKMLFPLPRNC